MASTKQLGILSLFEHVDKPVLNQVSLRGPGEASLVPTDTESMQILSRLNLRSLGIGIAPRGVPCSFFERKRLEEAMKLAKLLLGQPSYDEMVRVIIAIRPVVNEEICVFAMMYAFLNRRSTRNLRLPPVEEVLPYWYFPSTVINEADRRVKEAESEEERIVVPYIYSHNELDPEYRMAYFREDVGISSHHWHWHLAYPTTWTPADEGSKDRKGELFYYMHQQIMARYDVERLCNYLARVVALTDFRQKIELAYFPHMMSTISGLHFAARPAGLTPVDTVDVTIQRLELWKSRIMEAIHTQTVRDPSGKAIPLVDPRGIDMLGDLVESSEMSINQSYYGDFHNKGHLLIARIHDPLAKYGGDRGVMAFNSTDMRDPVFYAYHRMVDDIFDEYKQTLPPYPKPELEWGDVALKSVSVTGDRTKAVNILQTFWQQREVSLSHGVDFGRANPVVVRFTQLNHEEFEYKIELRNRSCKERQGVFRIFLAPVSDEFNDIFPFDQQRRLFIEMDKFQATLKPGKQIVRRRSELSNVTMPTPRGFDQLRYGTGEPDSNQAFCGCGWPQHMLIPKGRTEGQRFVLFVMVTDWEKDKVESLPEKTCGQGTSYCGIRDQKYPDKRTMGFPFDRRFDPQTTLESFRTGNMRTQEVIIRHTGETCDTNGEFQLPTIS